MSDRSLLQYDLEALRRSLPRTGAEMFLGFTPWPDDCGGWQRSPRESFTEAHERSVGRTIWGSPEHRDMRVLIDVVECTSAAEALDALVDRLAWNQLPKLEQGPKGLGYAAFRHPAGVPPGIFFIRGNLCVSVVSFGREAVVVDAWAERLNLRLSDRPTTERATISLRVEDSPLKVGKESILEYTMPWQYGVDGYLKMFATGGALVKKQKRLVLSAAEPGALMIEAYVLEPGREPHAGRVSVKVE